MDEGKFYPTRRRLRRRWNTTVLLAGFGLGFAVGIIGGWLIATVL